MDVHILTPNYDPLSWYLRKYKKVGFWENEIPEGKENLPLLITDAENEDLNNKLADTHESSMFGRTPWHLILIHVRKDLWDKLMEKRSAQSVSNF